MTRLAALAIKLFATARLEHRLGMLAFLGLIGVVVLIRLAVLAYSVRKNR